MVNERGEPDGEKSVRSLVNISMKDHFYEIFDDELNKNNLDYINNLLNDEQKQGKKTSERRQPSKVKIKQITNPKAELLQQQQQTALNSKRGDNQHSGSFSNKSENYSQVPERENKIDADADDDNDDEREKEIRFRSPKIVEKRREIETTVPLEKQSQGLARNHENSKSPDSKKIRENSSGKKSKSAAWSGSEKNLLLGGNFMNFLDGYINYFDKSEALTDRENKLVESREKGSSSQKNQVANSEDWDRKRDEELKELRGMLRKMITRETILSEKLIHYKKVAKDYSQVSKIEKQ